MIGYDLDGTLCNKPPKRDKPFFQQNGEERSAYEEEKLHHYVNAKRTKLIPVQPFVIITGRSAKYLQPTLRWLEKNDLHPEAVVLMETSRTRENMIAHKVDQCKNYQVIQYYEDDEKIAKAMTSEGITVILVNMEEVENESNS